jgi:hypothetical protein
MFGWSNKKKGGYKRSRSGQRQKNNLGIIGLPNEKKKLKFRDERLDLLDSYYENTQYDDLMEWSEECYSDGTFIPVRQRCPRIKAPIAKMMCSRLTSMMIGGSAFPDTPIADMPDEQEFINAVVRESHVKFRILEPFRRMLNTGSVFIRFYLSGGTMKVEHFLSKYCYPTFDDSDQLEKVIVKYVFEDPEELDKDGNFKKKWFKMELNKMSEIMYDNPDFDPDAKDEPEFTVVAQVDHELGFVQGTWFRTSEDRHSPDGYSMIADCLDFIDEMCYSMSQSSTAVEYNQDPQLAFSSMDSEELEKVIRSAAKSWNLGREGKAEFLESNLSGVEKAIELRDKFRQNIQDFMRILLMDPEKIVGNAQSAKAMEVLHGPMVDLVRELRGVIEPQLKELLIKMEVVLLHANEKGMDLPFDIPPGWRPQTIVFSIKWKPIFPETVADQQARVSLAVSAKNAGLLSRETALKNVADIFGVEDIELEMQMVDDDPVTNPFGGF